MIAFSVVLVATGFGVGYARNGMSNAEITAWLEECAPDPFPACRGDSYQVEGGRIFTIGQTYYGADEYFLPRNLAVEPKDRDIVRVIPASRS